MPEPFGGSTGRLSEALARGEGSDETRPIWEDLMQTVRSAKARGMCGIPYRFEIAALGRPRGHLAVAPCKRADAPGHWDLSGPWRRGTA